ncbi:hypothetical protein BCR44DRAFT_53996 [Catenaria anguillulae PL171]|uniref:WD40-repeat-containing domain protein n=1 Tax=Catenaria anguillulae PL171 TaxID=765915 RepID=A0A1Y2I0P2_9FUNG|nr:hypothetical protein BCR44DRAFT_53996 [Catenaria anguillulae PL171]
MTTFILPLVYWHPRPTEDDVTALTVHPDTSRVIAGTESGRIWAFALDTNPQPTGPPLIPQVLLVGHRAPVSCFAFTHQDTDVVAAGEEHVLVSASEDGEVCLWNLTDGQCLQVNSAAFPGVPRTIAVSACGQYLFVGGQAAQLIVLNSQTLEPIASSSDLSDWIIQFVFDELNFALTKLFHSNVVNPEDVVDPTILSMTSNATQTAFIGKREVTLYDWSIGKIQRSAAIPTPKGEADWAGGLFVDTKLLLWSRLNHLFTYDVGVSLTAPQSSLAMQFTSLLHIGVLGPRLIVCSGEQFQIHSLTDQNSPPSPLVSIRDFSQTVMTHVPSHPSKTAPHATTSIQDPVTCQALLPGFHSIVRGTALGRLQISPLSRMFEDPDVDVQAHKGSITCVHVFQPRTTGGLGGTPPQYPLPSDFTAGQGQQLASPSSTTNTTIPLSSASPTPPGTLIVTGSDDCTVRIFSATHGLTLLRTLRHHVSPITRILAAPSGAPYADAAIVTVAADHSLAIVRLADGAVLHWVPNAPLAPVELAWRDDLVLVAYAHHAGVHVWDTRAGVLDRIVHGDTARLVLAGCYPRLVVDDKAHAVEGGVQRTALAEVSMSASHVFMVNVKRVVADQELGLAHSLAAALVTSGVDPDMDALAGGGGVDTSRVTLGIRGTNGNLALMAPHHREGLTISPTVTATRLLALYLIARALKLQQNPNLVEAEFQAGYVRYLDGLASKIGNKGMSHASLAFLSRYWHDSLPTLQQGARLVFTWTLSKLNSEQVGMVVKYWLTHLPSVAGVGGGGAMISKTMARATIILAVIGCELPDQIPLHVAKEISLSLTMLMSESAGDESGTAAAGPSAGIGTGAAAGVYRLSAIELLGRGFPTWEPHISGAAVVRALIVLGTQAAAAAAAAAATVTSTGKAAQAQATAMGQPIPHPGPQPTIAPPQPSGPSQAIAAMARQSLLAIAGYHLAMVIQTIITDLEHGHTSSSFTSNTSHAHVPTSSSTAAAAGVHASIIDKAMLLRFTTYLVNKLATPLALSGSGVRLAEAVVQVLDPAHAHNQRDALLQPATGTLFEMVRRFPTVAFHAQAQRIATGHRDGRVVVWDLKTATRAHVIDAHLAAAAASASSGAGAGVTAVAFTPDGKSVVSYAAAEGAIKVWSPPSGFAFLMGAVSGGNVLKAVKVIAHAPGGLVPPPGPLGAQASPAGQGAVPGWMVQLSVVDGAIEVVDAGGVKRYSLT